jgi:NADPH-dependent 2,4-dienoyl-CoA reductase/sulfur reductase-like enzyme
VYQPGLLYVPFGLADPGDIVEPRNKQLHDGIDFYRSDVDSVHIDDGEVHLTDGSVFGYDVLIVATGAQLLPGETEGMTGPGWMEKVFTFYSLEGAAALHTALERFAGGRVVVNVVDMPIKCPVAPLEFAFLADWFFHERGIRDRVDITYVTPLDAAFTTPAASKTLGGCSRRSTSAQPSLEIVDRGPVCRRRDARVPRARRRLGEQLSRFRTPLAALAPHRRGPVAVERRRSRGRVALRARRLRQQRSRRYRYRPSFARLALLATVVEVAGVEPARVVRHQRTSRRIVAGQRQFVGVRE